MNDTYKFYSRFNDVDNVHIQGHNRAHVVLNIIEDLTEKGADEAACMADVKAYLCGMSKREIYHLNVWLSKLLVHHPYIQMKDNTQCVAPFVILH